MTIRYLVPSKTAAAIILLNLAFGASVMADSNSRCSQLKDKPKDQLLQYLKMKSADDRTEPFCTEFALRNLEPNEEAVPTLFRYLTFRREQNELEQFGVVLRPGGDMYPATDGLMEYGSGSGEPPKLIIDAVVTFLSQALSDLQVTNAVQVLTYYYRERPEEGVTHIIKESLKPQPALSSERLRSAARILAQRCAKASRDACIQAAGGNGK